MPYARRGDTSQLSQILSGANQPNGGTRTRWMPQGSPIGQAQPRWGRPQGFGSPATTLSSVLAQAPQQTASGSFAPVSIGAAQPAQLPMQYPSQKQLPNILSQLQSLQQQQQQQNHPLTTELQNFHQQLMADVAARKKQQAEAAAAGGGGNSGTVQVPSAGGSGMPMLSNVLMRRL